MFCTNCGHRNRDDAHFCANCGDPLQADSTLGLSQVEVEDELGEDLSHLQEDLETGQALLAVKRGPNAGSTFLIETGTEVTSIGRDSRSSIFLDDVTVSRKHGEIRHREEGFFVHDLGSLNGTYVNRERVEETKLAAGDELQIGKFKLLFFPGE